MTEFGILIQTAGNPVGEVVAAESLGFDFVSAGEHVSWHEPAGNSLLTLAAAAPVTDRIGLMSSIVLTPTYPPVLLAKLTAHLAHLSGGRLQLGLGVGGENPNELEACGASPRERGARTSETVAILQQLWAAQEPATFRGRFASFDGISIKPAPPGGTVPIWIAGRSEAAMRRVVEHHCNWLPYMFSPKQMADSLARIAELGEHVPRAGVLLWTAIDQNAELARERALRALMTTFAQDFGPLLDAFCLVGTPETVAARLLEYLEAGATRVVFAPCASNEFELAVTRNLLAHEVLPRIRASGAVGSLGADGSVDRRNPL
jgi:alkanesulfonate monooxygenase SsuD/methylene tetrahydromethanopterin reductase-like flavin-dependent oxidoreductase (luciferase family)